MGGVYLPRASVGCTGETVILFLSVRPLDQKELLDAKAETSEARDQAL